MTTGLQVTVYTVRVVAKVAGTRRVIREFIRPERTINTSSHATRFASADEADAAGWELARTAGWDVVSVDTFAVSVLR